MNSSTGIAQRARHPDELKKDDGKWMIDIDYYLSQQVSFSTRNSAFLCSEQGELTNWNVIHFFSFGFYVDTSGGVPSECSNSGYEP